MFTVFFYVELGEKVVKSRRMTESKQKSGQSTISMRRKWRERTIYSIDECE